MPSPEDLKQTERVIEAGELIGIPVRDHVIIGNGEYNSVKLSLKCQESKPHLENAETLIKLNENLKGKKALNRAEIKSLSKTLRESVYKIFLTAGIEKSCLEEFYRAIARYNRRRQSY